MHVSDKRVKVRCYENDVMACFSFGIRKWISDNGDSEKQREFANYIVFSDNNPANIIPDKSFNYSLLLYCMRGTLHCGIWTCYTWWCQ